MKRKQVNGSRLLAMMLSVVLVTGSLVIPVFGEQTSNNAEEQIETKAGEAYEDEVPEAEIPEDSDSGNKSENEKETETECVEELIEDENKADTPEYSDGEEQDLPSDDIDILPTEEKNDKEGVSDNEKIRDVSLEQPEEDGDANTATEEEAAATKDGGNIPSQSPEDISSEPPQEIVLTEAQNTSAGDFTVIDGVLTAYSGQGGAVVIPDGVTAIGEGAFGNCDSITNVSFPDSLIRIENDAFSWCSNLTSIDLPSSLITIGRGAFSDTALNKVILPDSVNKVGDHAFYNCAFLQYFEFGNGVSTLEEATFEECSALKEVIIGSHVNSIEGAVFSGCASLTSIWFKGDAPVINDEYFLSNRTLEARYYQNNATWTKAVKGEIGKEANITWIPVDENGNDIGIPTQEYVYKYDGKTYIFEIDNNTMIISLADDQVQGEDSYDLPFEQYKDIVKILIVRDGVEALPGYSFSGFENLESVSLPGSLGNTGVETFSNCISLKSVSLSDGIGAIGLGCFENCSSLEELVFPESVTALDIYAFGGCTSLKHIVFHGDMPELYGDAFTGATADAYYPAGNNTWAIDTLVQNAEDYGTTGITWIEDQSSLIPITDVQLNEYEFTYTGENILPSVTVRSDWTILSPETDYTVSYSNNINVGTATVMVTGKGQYCSTLTITFSIIPSSINRASITGIEDKRYTGNVVLQNPIVQIDGRELIRDTDYTVGYSDNIDAGMATVVIKGTGNYTGSVDRTFTINPVSISEVIISDVWNKTYNGTAHIQNPVLMFEGMVLTEDADYTVSYQDNINAGTATVSFTGVGNYSGSKNANFFIYEADITDTAEISGIEDRTYTGYEQYQNPVIKNATKTLVQNKDYAITYYENINAGTARAFITFIGNYKGGVEKEFRINPVPINDAEISGVTDRVYNGNFQIQHPVVKLQNRTLTEGNDYTVTYSDNLNAGEVDISINGLGNYEGITGTTFLIAPQNILDTVRISGICDKVYDGSAQVQDLIVSTGTTTLASGKDYVVEYSNNINAGTAKITITGTGNYAGIITKEFTISEKSISEAEISGIVNKTFNGSGQAQALVVKMSDTTLIEGKDYTVSYSDNINAGTAKITITGTGNYAGTVDKSFTIAKANQNFTVKAAASSINVGKTTRVTGSGAKETNKYTFTSSNTKVATVNSAGTVTGKSAGTVTITVKTAATTNYKAGTKAVKITVTASKTLKKPGNCHFTKWNNSKYTGCRISWNKVDGAEGYQTLLSWTDGSHSSATIVKSNVLYRDCTVHPQHVSQMKVRAFYTLNGQRKYGPWSNVEYITPSPAKLTTKNASSGSNLKMNISWNIIYGCNGYNVFITTNPNGKWYWNQSTTEKATATSASIDKCGGAKLKKNTRYYVRIVTRRKRNGVFCTVPMPANNTYIGSFVIK